MASLPDLDPRPFSVADYDRMIDAGILGEDERVELLEGVIVRMSPQSRRHARIVERLTQELILQFGRRYRVLPQLPLTLGDRSQPEPDLAIVSEDDSATEHPRSALVVIEVSGDSLRKDRLVKARIYAQARIPEYWVINLDDEQIEVHRDPDPQAGAYRTQLAAARGESLRSSAIPELVVSVADLFD